MPVDSSKQRPYWWKFLECFHVFLVQSDNYKIISFYFLHIYICMYINLHQYIMVEFYYRLQASYLTLKMKRKQFKKWLRMCHRHKLSLRHYEFSMEKMHLFILLYKSRWRKAIISNFGRNSLWDVNSHEIFHSKMKFLDKLRVQVTTVSSV